MYARRMKWAVRLLVALVPAGILAGCNVDSGGIGRTVPVSGRVSVDGQPLSLEGASVTFFPDASKSNTSKFEPFSRVAPDGTYTLSTGKTQKPGAPPGWYKVAVIAQRTRSPNEPPS